MDSVATRVQVDFRESLALVATQVQVALVANLVSVVQAVTPV